MCNAARTALPSNTGRTALSALVGAGRIQMDALSLIRLVVQELGLTTDHANEHSLLVLSNRTPSRCGHLERE